MCGRFTATISREILEKLYQIDITEEIVPRYNIAPSQYALVLRINPSTGERELVSLKWGLIPGWFKQISSGPRPINARAESVSYKPVFKKAFKHRRALVPASGFYEWKRSSGVRQPYLIRRTGGQPFSLAGLWERWESGSAVIESFAIITVNAGQKVTAIHDRMPVIIPEADYRSWLNPASPAAEIASMLTPFPDEYLTVYPVSSIVNHPGNDLPECLLPVSLPEV